MCYGYNSISLNNVDGFSVHKDLLNFTDLKADMHISQLTLFISLIRMRSKRDIKMGRLSTPGGVVLGIVGGGVRFRFLNGEAIFEEYMLFWVRLYALVVVLKILLDFSL